MNAHDPRTDDDLVAFLDGALEDGAAADRVRARLAVDPAFRRRADELRALDDLLGALPAAVARPGAVEAAVAAAAAESSRERFRSRFRRAASAAVVLIAVGVAWPLFGGAEPSPTPAAGEHAAVAELAQFAALAPVEETEDELADVEADLALIERVQNDYFSD
jgi:anti-sigma factor RsiW